MLVSPVQKALWIKRAVCEPGSPHRAAWDRYALAFAAEVRQGSEQFLENDSAAELSVRVMSLLPKRAACVRRYSAGSGNLTQNNAAAERFIDHLYHVLLNGAAGPTIYGGSVGRYTTPLDFVLDNANPPKKSHFKLQCHLR